MTTRELYSSIGVSGYEHEGCWRKDGIFHIRMDAPRMQCRRCKQVLDAVLKHNADLDETRNERARLMEALTDSCGGPFHEHGDDRHAQSDGGNHESHEHRSVRMNYAVRRRLSRAKKRPAQKTVPGVCVFHDRP